MNKGFNEDQLSEIEQGLAEGLDVSSYADPEYDSDQMLQIRLGLERGLDISYFDDPQYDWKQMREIRNGLEEGLDVSEFSNSSLDSGNMYDIRHKLEQGNTYYYINGWRESEDYFFSFGFTDSELMRLENGETLTKDGNEFRIDAH